MPDYASEDGSDGSTRTIWTERLRLEFRWATDRWRHEISVLSRGTWRRVACSSEIRARHDSHERTPCPAYQQFHHQAGEGRSIALLVGQSGAHHFSASFEVEEHPAATTVRVDVADRVRGDDPRLACTYLAFGPPAAMIVDSPARIAWDVDDAGRLTLSQAGPVDRPSRVSLGELAGESALVLTGTGSGDDAITPIVILEDPEPGAPALRCRYRWTLEAAGDRGSQPM